MVHRRFLLLFFLLLLFHQLGVKGEEKEYDLTVSATTVEGQPLTSTVLTDVFSDKINCRNNFKSKIVKNRDWTKVPTGTSAANHVNLMTVRFGKRTEYLAFMFEKPGEVIDFAAHAPVLEDQVVKYFFAASPGDYEIPRNAPTDLVANVANSIGERGGKRDTLGIAIKAWTESDSISLDDDSGGLDMGVANVPSESDLKKLMPIVCAAVYGAGLKPSLGKSDQTVTFKFRRQADGFDIQATLKGKGKPLTVTHRGTLFENIYYDIMIITHNLLHWHGALTDFARISDAHFNPLTIYQFKDGNEQKAYVVGSRPGRTSTLEAYASKSPKPVWENARIPIDHLITSNGSLLFFDKNAVCEVQLKTGLSKTIAPIGADSSSNVAISGKSSATVIENKVAFATNGRKQWRKEIKSSISAGPVITKDSVIVSMVDGQCVALAKTDGTVKWSHHVKPVLKGRLSMVKDLCLGSLHGGKLAALNPADGKVLWSVSVGDVLLQPPLDIDSSIFAVSKVNKLLVLNPADGKVIREKSWPTWILKALYLKDTKSIICLDLQNRITLLNWSNFAVKKQYKLPFKLRPLIIISPKFPSSWNGGNDLLAEPKPAWIFFDQKGYMYIFNPNKVEGGTQ